MCSKINTVRRNAGGVQGDGADRSERVRQREVRREGGGGVHEPALWMEQPAVPEATYHKALMKIAPYFWGGKKVKK